MPSDKATTMRNLTAFVNAIMAPQLLEFAEKLSTDLVGTASRTVETFQLAGLPGNTLSLRAGVELARLAGRVATACAIQAGTRAAPHSKEITADCQRAVVKIFQTCLESEAECTMEKHLKQSD